jgi:heme exporter protein D
MVWHSFHAFLSMGGEGVYVWPAYGVAALVMIGLVVASLYRLRRTERQLRAFEASDDRRRDRRARRAASSAAQAAAAEQRSAGSLASQSGSVGNDA